MDATTTPRMIWKSFSQRSRALCSSFSKRFSSGTLRDYIIDPLSPYLSSWRRQRFTLSQLLSALVMIPLLFSGLVVALGLALWLPCISIITYLGETDEW